MHKCVIGSAEIVICFPSHLYFYRALYNRDLKQLHIAKYERNKISDANIKNLANPRKVAVAKQYCHYSARVTSVLV